MTDDSQAISAYFAAMRRGAAAEDDMIALFTDDAVYEEPFSGSSEPAVGREAIRSRLRAGWEQSLPDMELDVLSVEVTGNHATATWECRSSAFEVPARGHDQYEFRDGCIAVLRVTVDPSP